MIRLIKIMLHKIFNKLTKLFINVISTKPTMSINGSVANYNALKQAQNHK